VKTVNKIFPQKSFLDFYIAFIRMMNDLISIYYRLFGRSLFY